MNPNPAVETKPLPMNALFARLTLIAAFACVALCGVGCATSERAAVKKLDMTHEAIEQASSLLAADPELSRFPIVVDGFKGDMRLKGQVATPAQKSRAEKILWAVRGVKSVDNQLKLGTEAAR
jgi:osmotically-inducible protein OsmY